MYDRSGWAIHSMLPHQLITPEIAPCEGISNFPLPKELSKKSNERKD